MSTQSLLEDKVISLIEKSITLERGTRDNTIIADTKYCRITINKDKVYMDTYKIYHYPIEFKSRKVYEYADKLLNDREAIRLAKEKEHDDYLRTKAIQNFLNDESWG